MKIIECWSVQAWDGGERHNHIFYVTSEEEKNKYLAEHKFDTAYKQTMHIFDTLEEYELSKSNKLKEQALAKLTDLEKKALGLL